MLNLLKDIQNILEATKEAGAEVKEIFKDADLNGQVGHFQKKKVFDARPAINGEEIVITSPGKVKKTMTGKIGLWVIRDHSNITVNDVLNDRDFKLKMVPVRNDQRPDAEGFKMYREIGEYEAFKYDDKPFSFRNTQDELQRVSTGDWIVKSIDAGLYFVVKAAEFNAAFQKI